MLSPNDTPNLISPIPIRLNSISTATPNCVNVSSQNICQFSPCEDDLESPYSSLFKMSNMIGRKRRAAVEIQSTENKEFIQAEFQKLFNVDFSEYVFILDKQSITFILRYQLIIYKLHNIITFIRKKEKSFNDLEIRGENSFSSFRSPLKSSPLNMSTSTVKSQHSSSTFKSSVDSVYSSPVNSISSTPSSAPVSSTKSSSSPTMRLKAASLLFKAKLSTQSSGKTSVDLEIRVFLKHNYCVLRYYPVSNAKRLFKFQHEKEYLADSRSTKIRLHPFREHWFGSLQMEKRYQCIKQVCSVFA